MLEENSIHEQLKELNVPKQSIDKVLYHLAMEQIKSGHKPKRTLLNRIKYFFCIKLYTFRGVYVLINLKDKALVLLKTQFAKKPKNPV